MSNEMSTYPTPPPQTQTNHSNKIEKTNKKELSNNGKI